MGISLCEEPSGKAQPRTKGQCYSTPRQKAKKEHLINKLCSFACVACLCFSWSGSPLNFMTSATTRRRPLRLHNRLSRHHPTDTQGPASPTTAYCNLYLHQHLHRHHHHRYYWRLMVMQIIWSSLLSCGWVEKRVLSRVKMKRNDRNQHSQQEGAR